MTEFQKLQKENPEVDLSKIYIVISDEEWKKRQEIRIPDWVYPEWQKKLEAEEKTKKISEEKKM